MIKVVEEDEKNKERGAVLPVVERGERCTGRALARESHATTWPEYVPLEEVGKEGGREGGGKEDEFECACFSPL